MKTLLKLLVLSLAVTLAGAEDDTSVADTKRTPEDLDKLVAPIALYPDALVALILPASTFTADVVLAARFLDQAEGEIEFDDQPWDDSVKSLARYPELVKWMDENLEWTRELGAAFVAQPTEVMNTVQKLRAKAQASGLLKDTPEQRIVVQEEKIHILPARTEYVYIPRYDPEILYVREYYSPRPLVEFSIGFAVGSWLFYDLDWHNHRVWMYRRPPGWVYRPDWRWHHPAHVRVDRDPWRPSPHYWRHHKFHHRDRLVHRHVPRVTPPRFHRHDAPDGRPGWHADNRGHRRTDGRPGWRREGRPDVQRGDELTGRTPETETRTGNSRFNRPNLRDRRDPQVDSRKDQQRFVPPASRPVVGVPPQEGTHTTGVTRSRFPNRREPPRGVEPSQRSSVTQDQPRQRHIWQARPPQDNLQRPAPAVASTQRAVSAPPAVRHSPPALNRPVRNSPPPAAQSSSTSGASRFQNRSSPPPQAAPARVERSVQQTAPEARSSGDSGRSGGSSSTGSSRFPGRSGNQR